MVRKIFKRAHHVPNTRTTRFVRKYGLSMFITIFFSAFIFQMLFLHAVPGLPVANVLTGLTNIGADYNPITTTNTDFKETSGAISNPATDSSSSTPDSSQNNSQTNTAIDIQSSSVLNVGITSIHQDDPKLNCRAAKQKNKDCTKQYIFTANVATNDGPGGVAYGWRSTLPQAVESGEFTTHGASDKKTLTKTITLACDSPTRFTVQLIITSPNDVHSQVLTVNHNCDESDH